jgi:hypothetical protein
VIVWPVCYNLKTLYNDQVVMPFAAIFDQIDRVDKHVEDLRMDMQSAIHNEFMHHCCRSIELARV